MTNVQIYKKGRYASLVFALTLLATIPSFAQFSGTLTGVVTDPHGAAIEHASITITNLNTLIVKSTTSDASGTYIFVSMAPGTYSVAAARDGFATTSRNVILETGQTLNVPIVLTIATARQTVQVTSQEPLLDTAETRNQLTLDTQSISSLPLAGRNMISLVTLAPGVVGLGTQANGSPGSGVDNFSTETQVDASANGLGEVSNMYIVDGLDVTSNARSGVLNLTSNPDTIQEVSIQTNTYNVDYGRASSIQMAMTTKSGADHYHGNASIYYTTQQLWTHTEFTPQAGYAPFHSNNMSATIGGPIVPHHQSFFFFGIEPQRELTASGNGSHTFEDPEFTQWAQQNYPNTLGTELLTSYSASAAVQPTVVQTAAQVFPGTCGTPATDNIPCTLPMLDSGLYNASGFRNGNQYFLRLDKYFTNDRVYASAYRTTLDAGVPSIRPALGVTSPYDEWAAQFNETHTFGAKTVNEATLGLSQVSAISAATGKFYVPIVTVVGMGTGFGTPGSDNQYSQKSLRWRDVLSKLVNGHLIKIGLEGYAGNYEENHTPINDTPSFTILNLLDLVQDNVYSEARLAYNLVTGAKSNFLWDAGQITNGIFAEDSWRLKRNLTINYGVRWDDFGNAYPITGATTFAPFYLGPGQTPDENVANGFIVQKHHALNRAITDIFSPRAGVVWDPTGSGKWVVRGGAGIYHNMPSLGALNNEYQGSPPGPAFPTFLAGGTPAPIFTIGNANTAPFGYTFPVLAPTPLDSKGGVPGYNLTIGSVDPDLTTPVAYVYSSSVERAILDNMVVSIGYSGSLSRRLLSGGGETTSVNYGVDWNSYPGDLIEHNSSIPTRLNSSFGVINYTTNDREGNYNALIIAVRGRFAQRGFFTASYTRSASKDDSQNYPTWQDPHQFYGPSVWDAPNRVSAAWSYEVPGYNRGSGLLGHISGGWQLSGTEILQSGYPYTVYTSAAFQPTRDQNGVINGIKSTSGDYNANGDNNDYPNATSYKTPTSRHAYLTGVFSKSGSAQDAFGYANFPLPQLGIEGNEQFDGFRGPGFAETDFAVLKDTQIHEAVALEFRADVFNLFNRPNLTGIDTNLSDGTFGRATSQLSPRWIQLGANLKF